MNAFKLLGLRGLASTSELRQVSERARVKRAMSGSAASDASASTVERLISDPAFRLREAAGWYYDFKNTDDAAAAVPSLNEHDGTLLQFERLRTSIQEGRYTAEALEQACLSAVGVLDEDESHLPLERLVMDIADPRVDASMALAVLQEAVVSWLCEALFSIARSLGPDITRKAAEYVRDAEFSDEEDDAMAAKVLLTSASEVESALVERGVQIRALIEAMEEDASNDRELIRATDALIAVASPWDALVDVFDDEVDTGDEGRALDGVANLVRSASVALANHADDYDAARRLLKWAEEIAQSSSLKSKVTRDMQTARFVAAHTNVIAALRSGSFDAAVSAVAEMQRSATTEEERVEAAKAAAVVDRMQRQRVPVAQASGGGCGSIIGGLFAVVSVIGIGGAIVGAISGSGESGGESTRNSISNPTFGGVSQDDNGFDAEAAAIEIERSRLTGVEGDLDRLQGEIDVLRTAIEATEALYPNGAPPNVISNYERNLRNHNLKVDEYNSLLRRYQDDLDAFNRRIDAYNAR